MDYMLMRRLIKLISNYVLARLLVWTIFTCPAMTIDCRSVGIGLQTTIGISLDDEANTKAVNEYLPEKSAVFYKRMNANNTCYSMCETERENLACQLNNRTWNPDHCRKGSGVCSLDFRSHYDGSNAKDLTCTCYAVFEYKRYQREERKIQYLADGTTEEISTCSFSDLLSNLNTNVDGVMWAPFGPGADGSPFITFIDEVYCEMLTMDVRFGKTVQRCAHNGECLKNKDIWMFTTWYRAKKCDHAGEWFLSFGESDAWHNAYDGKICKHEPDSSCLTHCSGPWSGN